MSNTTLNLVNASNFAAEVLQSEVPVLVDFFADWCGPCKALAPVLEAYAQQQAGKVKVVKVDVQAERNLAAQYEVMSLPTLLVFSKGEVVGIRIGAGLTVAQLDAFVQENL